MTPPLADALITATMTQWMVVDAIGDECLFGYATWHPNTGGLSWVLSTPIVEFTESADRARTSSGRVYSLGQVITARDLDEEGRIALRLLLAVDPNYPGVNDDRNWVIAQKMARHLRLAAPRRSDHVGVERFLEEYHNSYTQRLRKMRGFDGL
ncbi:hypothetical protein [Acidisphaera sp. S103]|uniref:hypothetical protein n=1 Tax=Acidisphaera sp. S103 TaxID=1747223 RepID=UPI00131CD1BB|nr:hypothetical protein [Acidisphaera sp. S103]